MVSPSKYPDEALQTPSTYYQYGPQHQWPYDDLTYMRPAPPRHPLVSAMVSEVKQPSKQQAAIPLMYYSCWRLRWCGMLLLLSTTVQAVAVGSQISAETTPATPATPTTPAATSRH